MKTPPLTIVVKYDHSNGKFRVTTDRGATFFAEHYRDLCDRLGNACSVYRREVIEGHNAAYRAPAEEVPFSYSYDEAQVRAFDRLGNPVLPALEFDELELDL